jgi:hypothetical protein
VPAPAHQQVLRRWSAALPAEKAGHAAQPTEKAASAAR